MGGLLRFLSRRQKTPLLSSWESALHAAVSTGVETLGLHSGLGDFGNNTRVTIACDNQGVVDHTARQGLGLAKHVHTRHFWLQAARGESRLQQSEIGLICFRSPCRSAASKSCADSLESNTTTAREHHRPSELNRSSHASRSRLPQSCYSCHLTLSAMLWAQRELSEGTAQVERAAQVIRIVFDVPFVKLIMMISSQQLHFSRRPVSHDLVLPPTLQRSTSNTKKKPHISKCQNAPLAHHQIHAVAIFHSLTPNSRVFFRPHGILFLWNFSSSNNDARTRCHFFASYGYPGVRLCSASFPYVFIVLC